MPKYSLAPLLFAAVLSVLVHAEPTPRKLPPPQPAQAPHTLDGRVFSSHTGYYPAPSAISPARAQVTQQLRELGKELKLPQGEDLDCPDMRLETKVLMDTSVFFSLEVHDYWACHGETTRGRLFPLLFDMRAGREYDIGLLYQLTDPAGHLLPQVRRLVLARLNPKNLRMGPQAVESAVDADLVEPQLYVTKTGIRIWPAGQFVWLDDVILTWTELRPYLNSDETKRLGWSPR